MSDRSRIEEIAGQELSVFAEPNAMTQRYAEIVARKVLNEFVRALHGRMVSNPVLWVDALDATLRTFLGEEAR